MQLVAERKMSKPESRKVVRTTVSLPATHYDQLEKIAEDNRVSVAWVIRSAVENYLNCSRPEVGGNVDPALLPAIRKVAEFQNTYSKSRAK